PSVAEWSDLRFAFSHSSLLLTTRNRSGPWSNIRPVQPHSPLDCLRIHPLHARIIPILLRMPQSRVINPPLAVSLSPRHSKIMILPMHFRIAQIQLARLK